MKATFKIKMRRVIKEKKQSCKTIGPIIKNIILF